jgi:hypothetical protein
MDRDRWLKVGLVLGLLVVAVFGGFVLWHRKTYHEWPGASFPDRLEHCHRAYNPGDRVSEKDAPRLQFDFRYEPELAAHHDVYIEPDKLFTNDEGERCPMVYWMKDGSSYREFGLLGGP